MQSATERDDFVTILWQNIQPGNVSVFTHKNLIQLHQFPVHKYITLTPHHCHYYVQQQWLFKQRAGIAENILESIWNLIYGMYRTCKRTFVSTYLTHLYKLSVSQCRISNNFTSHGQNSSVSNFYTHTKKTYFKHFFKIIFKVFTPNLDTRTNQDIMNPTTFIGVHIYCANHMEST
jgi:hypothetical protein